MIAGAIVIVQVTDANAVTESVYERFPVVPVRLRVAYVQRDTKVIGVDGDAGECVSEVIWRGRVAAFCVALRLVFQAERYADRLGVLGTLDERPAGVLSRSLADPLRVTVRNRAPVDDDGTGPGGRRVVEAPFDLFDARPTDIVSEIRFTSRVRGFRSRD